MFGEDGENAPPKLFVDCAKSELVLSPKTGQKANFVELTLAANIGGSGQFLLGKQYTGTDFASLGDDYLYCEECDAFFSGGSCAGHPVIHVLDKASTGGRSTCRRAANTLPPFLEVSESSIADAGLGVFTTVDLPNGVVFGPYKGKIVHEREAAEKSGYAWEVRRQKRAVFVDGSDEKHSNWLRYVNSSRWESEQNLVAFQYYGAIFYKTFKSITANSELLVWYGNSYGKSLGAFKTSKQQNKNKMRIQSNPFIFS